MRCPKCQAEDLPPPARPTLERLQNGTIYCSVCAHVWVPKP